MTDLDKAVKVAVGLLAKRNLSRKQVESKLVGFESHVVHDALVHLERKGVLSDLRFAEGFVQAHGDLPASRLVDQLAEAGVDAAIIAEVTSLRAGDIELAVSLVLKKKYSDPGKASRYLASKGFEYETIHSAIESVFQLS